MLEKGFSIFKAPYFEDDSSYICFYDFNIIKTDFDEYTQFKLNKFAMRDFSKFGVEKFSNTPSFRIAPKVLDFRNTIYTVTASIENNIKFDDMLLCIKKMLEKNSRRAIIRLVNPLTTYYVSFVNDSTDVTCLNLIHYLKINNKLIVRLIFRAIDLKVEAYTDVVTVFKHFIEPIKSPNETIQLDIIASTTQNISEITNFARKLYNV